MKLVLILTWLVSIVLLPAASFSQRPDERAETVKKAVAQIGSQGTVLAEVKLRAVAKLNGKIVSMDPNSFDFVVQGTTALKNIPYSDVDTVKKAGRGLSKGAIIGMVAAGIGAAVRAALLVKRCRNELSCGAGR